MCRITYTLQRQHPHFLLLLCFFLILVYFVKNKLRKAKPINSLLNHLYQWVYFSSYTGSIAHPDLYFEESVLIFSMTEEYSRGCKKKKVQGVHFSCGRSTGFNHQFQILFISIQNCVVLHIADYFSSRPTKKNMIFFPVWPCMNMSGFLSTPSWSGNFICIS